MSSSSSSAASARDMRPRATAPSTTSCRRARVMTTTSRGSTTLLSLRHEELEQRLLGVTTVLRLVPDPLPRPVEDLRGDLLAGVRGQAVQGERARRRQVEQGVVDAVLAEGGTPCVRGRLVVGHGDPNVRVEDVRARRGGGGVVEQARARAVLELVAGRRG